MNDAVIQETDVPETPARLRLGHVIELVYDPEWLICFGILLLPAILFALLGEPLKCRFFGGTAIYVGVLKWLGWIVLGRRRKTDLSYLFFPFEVFVGLAVTSTWFYLRNGLTLLWPQSYSLRELSILIYVLLPLHLAGSRVTGLALRMNLGRRLALYGPFVVCITVALWNVSGLLGVLGTDSIHYVFSARVYLNDGIHFSVPPLNHKIVYPTALSGMSAVAAAIAPLSVVQSFHLQHVLFCILSLFIFTTTIAMVVQQPLGCLHSVPLLFLSVFPLYALYPDILYPGVPKQIGPPLCVAICLLPRIISLTRMADLYIAAWIVAVLSALAADANPACVPFVGLAAAIALVVFCIRGQSVPWYAIWKVGTIQVCTTLLACLVVLGGDPWYRETVDGMVRPQESVPASAAVFTEKDSFFSAKRSSRHLADVSLLRLSPAISLTAFDSKFLDSVKGWPAHWPQEALPWAAILLVGAYILSRVMSRNGGGRGSGLGSIALTCLLINIGLKYVITFVAGGISRASWEGIVLNVYTRYLLIRFDILLLFGCAMTAGVWLVMELPGARLPRPSACKLRLLLTVVLCWIVPGYLIASGSDLSGCVKIPVNDRFKVTREDLELVAWADTNLPVECGSIGLAAFTFEAGLGQVEKHIYPVGSGVAFAFYSHRYNVRFLLPSLEEKEILGRYRNHVRDRFDSEWFAKNGIGYFYVPAAAAATNSDLETAVQRGILQPLRRTQDATLYRVIAPTNQTIAEGR